MECQESSAYGFGDATIEEYGPTPEGYRRDEEGGGSIHAFGPGHDMNV